VLAYGLGDDLHRSPDRRSYSSAVLRWTLVAVLAIGIAAVLSTPAGAADRHVNACRFVTFTDARSLLGPDTYDDTNASVAPSCLYGAPPKNGPTGIGSNLLVQVWSMPRPASIPGKKLAVAGMTAWWFDPPLPPNAVSGESSTGSLTSYRKGQLIKVTAGGTDDDLGTAKAAMRLAFKRQ
jgi:hypothetical protein